MCKVAAASKRILVLSQGVPHSRLGASSVVFFEYLAAIKRSGQEVVHLCINDKPQGDDWSNYQAEIGPDTNFQVVYAQVQSYNYINLFALRMQPTTPAVGICERVKSFNPEIVLCFDLPSAAVAQEMGFRDLSVWFGDLQYRTFLYNFLYDLKEGFGSPKATLTQWFSSLLYYITSRRLYQKVLPNVCLAIASSNSSVWPLRKLGALNTKYLPYPWPDCDAVVKEESKFEIPTFIMFGTLSALGSKSALNFFLTKVLPLLRAQWGERGFEVLISGARAMPPWAERLVNRCPEVKFLGYVENLAALVRRCHAVLAPIDVPVGNRSRIITAMSMRALVIAHSNTALGNPELVSGVNCYLADSAQAFASCMRRAVENKTEAEYLGNVARTTYLRSFEPSSATRSFVTQLLDSHNSNR